MYQLSLNPELLDISALTLSTTPLSRSTFFLVLHTCIFIRNFHQEKSKKKNNDAGSGKKSLKNNCSHILATAF